MKIRIDIKSLTKIFPNGNISAINSLDMQIGAGMLHGIIGPDGAGKTTLFRLIAGLLHPNSGTIKFYDGDIEINFQEIRSKIAYMPSSASLYPDLSIEEHLLFFKSLHNISEQYYAEKSQELLKITRLEKFKDRRIAQLSGGMYKKVALMCTLLSSPSLLLLDEPTNGVDPISRREFWELLYDLVAKNITILVSTAYMDEAERCAKVHFMDWGKVILSGTPLEIIKQAGTSNFDEIFLSSRLGVKS